MTFDSLEDGLNTGLNKVYGLLNNPTATALGGAVVGSALTGAVIKSTSSFTKKRRSTTRKSKRKTSRTSKRKTKYARTAGKRKDTSRRRIRMTKSGQPYIILASGKARFIKKSSARTSRKRKGGRY